MLLLILLLYYFWAGKWDRAREAVRMRGEEGEEGGQVIQLKPSSYSWSEFASKCLYCFMGFTHECQTTLRCLLSYRTSVHLSRGGSRDIRVKAHIQTCSRCETVPVSCNTKCCSTVKKRGMYMYSTTGQTYLMFFSRFAV